VSVLTAKMDIRRLEPSYSVRHRVPFRRTGLSSSRSTLEPSLGSFLQTSSRHARRCATELSTHLTGSAGRIRFPCPKSPWRSTPACSQVRQARHVMTCAAQLQRAAFYGTSVERSGGTIESNQADRHHSGTIRCGVDPDAAGHGAGAAENDRAVALSWRTLVLRGRLRRETAYFSLRYGWWNYRNHAGKRCGNSVCGVGATQWVSNAW